MWFDENYMKYYIPAHTNAGCYIIGIISGCIYKRIKMNDIDMKKYKVIWMQNDYIYDTFLINFYSILDF